MFVFLGHYAVEGGLDDVIERYPGGAVSGEYDKSRQLWDYRAYYLPPDLLDSYARRDSVTFSIEQSGP